MVVVEDLISTGGSVLEAVAAAKREGADVLGVVAIFSYQLPKADKNFSDAGVKLVTLSNYSELIHLAQEEGYITPEGLALLKRFKEDQEKLAKFLKHRKSGSHKDYLIFFICGQ